MALEYIGSDWHLLHLKVARAYAEENGLLFIETSAKSAHNVNDLFTMIGK